MRADMANLKTIGIVTIQGRSNYGNRLQNYATAEIIKDCGCRPISLILDRNTSISYRMRCRLKKLLGKYETPREQTISRERLAAFDSFNKLIELMTVSESDLKHLEGFDCFCTGSDQIWRFGKLGYGEEWGYLTFASKKQRIALSPSIGVDEITPMQSKRLAKYIAGFNSLSVREERGAELIKEASGRDAVVLCDPTMALSPARWRSLSNDRLTPRVPYVLVYVLGDLNGEIVEVRDAIARKYDQIVYLSDRERAGEPPAGPADFISLIDNARHVITDSYHASLFSALLETPLTIVKRSGGKTAHSMMFGRMETLTKKLGIEHKVYGSPQFDFARADDYRGVPEAIEREKHQFISYLEGQLNA